MKTRIIKTLGCLVATFILYELCKRTPPTSSGYEQPKPTPTSYYSSATAAYEAPAQPKKAKPLRRKESSMPTRTEYDLWNRPNMTMDGEEGINPWDAEQTEYDLMYEDPDLYDFIAD